MKKINKKVVFFIPDFQIGGAEKVTINIANELSKHVTEVIILVLNKNGPLINEVSDHVKIISLDKNRAVYSLFSFYLFLIVQRPDYIFSSLEHVNAITIFAKTFYYRKIKIFVTEHSTASHAVINSFFDKILHKLKKFIYSRADKVICVSKGSADDLIRNFYINPKKLVTIYNPVITPQFENIIEHLKSGNLKRPVSFRYIISIGRLASNKDFTTLIKAYANSKVNDSYHLVIAGEGPEREHLKKTADQFGVLNTVHFLGFVNNPLEWLFFSELFILTSKFEGLPTVLIEALGCSKKIISSDCPSGPREILENGKWGALFDVGDHEHLSRLIKSKLSSNENLDLSAACERFTSRKAAAKYVKLMEL